MFTPNVDIVLAIDASQSMKPCFDQLTTHLQALVEPMQGSYKQLRFGLVAYSASSRGGKITYRHHFLCGEGNSALQGLYHRDANTALAENRFFTDNAQTLFSVLKDIKPGGNEETLVALDTALDFPFGPVKNTKRVIALFSDEKIEKGVSEGTNNRHLDAIIDKIHARRVQLFGALPESRGANTLFEADGSELNTVDGGDGLACVDFSELLCQIGKSISVTSLQTTNEPEYQRAIFHQSSWTDQQSST